MALTALKTSEIQLSMARREHRTGATCCQATYLLGSE